LCSAQPLPPQQESALKALGTDGLFLFSSLDTDQDMYISPEEFKPIAEKLTGTREAGYREEGICTGGSLCPQLGHFVAGDLSEMLQHPVCFLMFLNNNTSQHALTTSLATVT
jgi:hypothetical protein